MKRNMSNRWVALSGSLVRNFSKCGRTLHNLWKVKATKAGLIVLPFTIFATMILFSWSQQSNSFAMNAYLCLLVFDIVAIVGDLLTQSYTFGGKPSIAFSFGYSRVEVLTHFSILSLGLFLNLWSLKVFATLALFVDGNKEIHTGRFLPAVIVGSAAHFTVCACNNKLFKLSKIFCTTTTLQRFVYRISNSFGLSIPSASTSLLTSFTTIGIFAGLIIIILNFTLESGSRWMDFVGGVVILTTIFDAIWPLFKHTAQILLQTVPPHVSTMLEKALREALTIDGVLEFRNEFFWTITYGHVAGTLHVRIRRDASEQLILVKLHDKLQTLVPHLTIQVMKDDFNRNFGALQILCDIPRPVHIMHAKPTGADISPIARPDGLSMGNRTIYSTSNTSVLSNSTNSPSALSSSFSSVIEDNKSLQTFYKHPTVSHARSASLDDTSRRNPFINASPLGNQPNILISSANRFAED